jgi:hypothetical protein
MDKGDDLPLNFFRDSGQAGSDDPYLFFQLRIIDPVIFSAFEPHRAEDEPSTRTTVAIANGARREASSAA